MNIPDFLKKTLLWLWPSLLIMVLSCFRKTVLESSNFDQIQNGLLLYAGYLLCIIPLGTYLSKSKWLNDKSKTALIILFLTYIFFEYTAILSTWLRFSGYWVEKYFNDKRNTVFILCIAFCGFGSMWLLRRLNDRRKNRALLLFTTLVLAIVPLVEFLLAPKYKFESDLFNIQQSDIHVDQAAIPQRIFWIILDEHPSSLVLDQVWGYKDTTFRRGLESLGFTVYDSCVSNYNFTPFSIAATTYGAMLPVRGPQFINNWQQDLLGKRIKQSPVMAFFKSQEYETRILSFFDSGLKKYFMHYGVIINSSVVNMLLYRFDNQYVMPQMFYNRLLVDSLQTLLHYFPNNSHKIFIYAHILMPHGPFLPLGTNSIQRKRHLFANLDDQAFLAYVRYTDSTILHVLHMGLDSLTPEQKSSTLVILQADHGPRYLQNGGKELRLKTSFGILNAVLWPQDSKVKFYNGMSSVNTFRILFRDLWEINIGTLKDSSVDVCPILKIND
jgi:FtsH-binding integral membrane protein